jgi:hypothetical protein
MSAALSASGVAGASVPAPSMGDILRVAAYVADLVGDDRIDGVNIYSTRHVYLKVPDPFHAATVAGLLGLTGPHDLPALPADEATGAGAHSSWEGHIQGVPVSVTSALRPGALPAPRPRDWPTSADDLTAVA